MNYHHKMSRSSFIFIFTLVVGFACGQGYPSFADNPLQIETNDRTVSVSIQNHPFLSYRYRDVPFKPYVQKLFTPKGLNVLRDAPHDHLHHHALMFAFSVDGVSFWEETEKAGSQVHRSFTSIDVSGEGNAIQARFSENLEWLSLQKKPLLNENRAITVMPLVREKATFLIWRSRFTLPAGKKSSTISGSHYYGLGMRFLESLDEIGKFSNSKEAAGRVVSGDERLTEADWCVYSVAKGETPVTIAMFDRPDNYRPVSWFTMSTPFSYLSATLLYHEKPFSLEEGQSLELRYAVAVWDGTAAKDRIDSLYRKWLGMDMK